MSDLASTLAALAESLEPATVTERANAAAVIDLNEILAMPLDQFARESHLLEVRVPWRAETLWFVPEERDAAALGSEGVSRGRVWTAKELIALMALADRTPEVVETITRAKLAIDADIIEVRPR